MVHKSRLISTIIFFVSMILTIVFALATNLQLLTLLMALI